jgi:hypothetical protein
MCLLRATMKAWIALSLPMLDHSYTWWENEFCKRKDLITKIQKTISDSTPSVNP